MYRYDQYDQAIVDARGAEFKDQVGRRLRNEITEDQFKPLRLMNGLYLQLHAYMLRVAIPYGTLSGTQMRMLAHIARKYDRDYGHFTTRQNIQYNWIKLEQFAGHDLVSGRHLNEVLLRVFRERQIYRIDHYLGKETVQNIFVLRFANGVFEPLWNHRYVDHVQIAVAESVGVGHRAGFYEKAGVVRDMFQNHLMQLLTLTAMEPPAAYEADAIRAEKVKVLRSIRPFAEGEVDDWAVRGQYGPGVVDGKRVPGYREEPKVDPKSMTSSYAAIKIAIDNWRWAGVPFYLRSGKRLGKRVSEIAIEFKGVPHRFFHKASGGLLPNVLRLHIQPDEGVSLKFGVKIPGPALQIQSVYMDFPYSKLGAPIHGGYERLLLDVTNGDQTLFIRGDEAEHAWEVLTPILNAWEKTPPDDFSNYAAGTFGPEAADKFLEKDGRRWRTL